MTATIVVVVFGAALMRAFDSENYATFGEAMWFTLQTVTTVGYGDDTPTSVVGRVVAGVVMLTGIGMLTVVTAAITSLFIEAARVRFSESRAEPAAQEPNAFARMEESLAQISERLERLEAKRDGNAEDERRP